MNAMFWFQAVLLIVGCVSSIGGMVLKDIRMFVLTLTIFCILFLILILNHK